MFPILHTKIGKCTVQMNHRPGYNRAMARIQCTECDGMFDPHSQAKKRAGGLRNNCPECSEETAVKYAGVAASDGKMAGVQVLKFENQRDRDGFVRFWRAASGMNVGKSCQLSNSTPAGSGSFSFQKVAEFAANGNHKGKL